MTLSILWRSEGRLHLASDSRMSFGAAGSADIGIKVMRLPVRVVGTELDEHSQLERLFESSYGFCYAGSLANAATFRQLIEDLLLDVQYIATDVPLSFDEICRFLCHFCAKVSTEVVSRLSENGVYTFFVAGLCPLTNQLRGARVHLMQAAGQTVASFEEVARHEGECIAVGTGAAEFDRLFAGQVVTLRSVLLTLNQVIDQGLVDTVGGDIQYGSFDRDAKFTVSGVARISIEEAEDAGKHYGPSKERVFRYRGFELYAGWQVPGDTFWPSPGFIELDVPSNKDSANRFIEKCRNTVAGRAQ